MPSVAVGQGKALLLGQHQRSEAGVGQCLGGGHGGALMVDHAFADQGEGDVGEGSEVTAGPERTVLVHVRSDVGVEHVDEPERGGRAGAAVAEGQRACAQEDK